MSCNRSSSGSPLGILDVKRGGMERELLVFTVLANDFGTRVGRGAGLGVGDTPASSTLCGEAEHSLPLPLSRHSSSRSFKQVSMQIFFMSLRKFNISKNILQDVLKTITVCYLFRSPLWTGPTSWSSLPALSRALRHGQGGGGGVGREAGAQQGDLK